MSVFSLRAHMKFHTDQVCLCTSCGLGFTSTAAFKIHTHRRHHQPVSCDMEVLSEKSVFLKDLKKHGEHSSDDHSSGVQHIRDENKKPCPIDGGDHLTCMPSGNSAVVTKSHCSKSHTDSSLTENLQHYTNRNIDDLREAEVNCAVSSSLQELQCSVCCQLFESEEQLKTHLRHHLNERNYLCDICGQGFRTAGQLKVHIRTHTGKNFVISTWAVHIRFYLYT